MYSVKTALRLAKAISAFRNYESSPLEPTLVILTQTDVPILLAFGHWMSGDDTHSDAAPRATRTETLAARLSKPKSL
jgi:hypothetical protein